MDLPERVVANKSNLQAERSGMEFFSGGPSRKIMKNRRFQ